MLTENVYEVANSITAKFAPKPPVSTATAFNVTATLYDSNGIPISAAPGTATLSEVSGPAGGFTPVSVSYVNGKFSFTNLHINLGSGSNLYVLEVSYQAEPGGPILTFEATVGDPSFYPFGAAGRLH